MNPEQLFDNEYKEFPNFESLVTWCSLYGNVVKEHATNGDYAAWKVQQLAQAFLTLRIIINNEPEPVRLIFLRAFRIALCDAIREYEKGG